MKQIWCETWASAFLTSFQVMAMPQDLTLSHREWSVHEMGLSRASDSSLRRACHCLLELSSVPMEPTHNWRPVSRSPRNCEFCLEAYILAFNFLKDLRCKWFTDLHCIVHSHQPMKCPSTHGFSFHFHFLQPFNPDTRTSFLPSPCHRSAL